MTDKEVRSPRCPGCDHEPVPLLDFKQQAFCSNGRCQVLCWNPTEDAARFKATAQIISFSGDGVTPFLGRGFGESDEQP